MSLLAAHNVRFSYGQRPVLRGISVGLEPGEILALLGPNGSGKSTLIRALLGHLRAEGTIEWDGRPIQNWRRRELARRIAYLPQVPAWEPEQRVGDVLRLGRAPYWQAFGIESPQDIQVIRQVAARLQLDDIFQRRLDEISGGQRQRVFLGRALAQEPAAMLLDEPGTYLDLRHQAEMLQLLRTLSRQRGIGVLMASHELNLAGAFADRMMLLSEGQAAASGKPDEVLQPDLLAQVYHVPMERIDRPGKPPIVIPDV